MELSPLMIDQNEEQELPGLAARIAALDVPVKLIPIRLGTGRVSVDYLWSATQTLQDGTVQVFGASAERKTVRDLIASANDGRLERQMGVMTQFPHRFLILDMRSQREVDVSLAYAGWTWERVLGLLRDVQYEGILIELVWGTGFERAISSLYRWTGRDEHHALHRPALPTVEGMYLDPNYRAQVAMLMCIPGIGEKAATALLERFITIKGVTNGRRNTYASVPGIGPKRAAGIATFLNGGKAPADA